MTGVLEGVTTSQNFLLDCQWWCWQYLGQFDNVQHTQSLCVQLGQSMFNSTAQHVTCGFPFKSHYKCKGICLQTCVCVVMNSLTGCIEEGSLL